MVCARYSGTGTTLLYAETRLLSITCCSSLPDAMPMPMRPCMLPTAVVTCSVSRRPLAVTWEGGEGACAGG